MFGVHIKCIHWILYYERFLNSRSGLVLLSKQPPSFSWHKFHMKSLWVMPSLLEQPWPCHHTLPSHQGLTLSQSPFSKCKCSYIHSSIYASNNEYTLSDHAHVLPAMINSGTEGNFIKYVTALEMTLTDQHSPVNISLIYGGTLGHGHITTLPVLMSVNSVKPSLYWSLPHLIYIYRI